jgi:hypothetical protein
MLRLLFVAILISGRNLTSASSSHEDGNHNQEQQLMALEELSLQDEGDALEPDGNDERRLQYGTVACQGSCPLNKFALSINFTTQPSVDPTKCTTIMQSKIAVDLNALLLNYGVGTAGNGDGAKYIASVCTKPTTLKRRRRLIIRGFVWWGGGICVKCPFDDGDGRLLLRGLQTTCDPNWFNNVYRPELQNVLRNAITALVVPKYPICFGGGPQVNVVVTQVASVPQCD